MARKIAYLDRSQVRLYLANQRVHHGACGLLMAAAALRTGPVGRSIGMLGLALALDDAHDWRRWFRRESLPQVS